MRRISSSEVQANFDAVIDEVRRTGSTVMVTEDGQDVAVITRAPVRERKFGQFPELAIPDDFDDPLSGDELAAWEGDS